MAKFYYKHLLNHINSIIHNPISVSDEIVGNYLEVMYSYLYEIISGK